MLTLDLHGGESVAMSGSDPGRYSLAESIEPDSWDAWNSDRDQALAAESAAGTGATSGFAESSNPAWSDLDANGNWYEVPDGIYLVAVRCLQSGVGPLRKRVLDVDAAVWLRLDIGLWVGLSAVPVWRVELLQQFRLGLGAGAGWLFALVEEGPLWRSQHRHGLWRLSSTEDPVSASTRRAESGQWRRHAGVDRREPASLGRVDRTAGAQQEHSGGDCRAHGAGSASTEPAAAV